MRKKIIAIFIILNVCGFALLFFWLFHKSDNANELTLYGNVDVRQVDIGFRVSGKVRSLLFEEGDKVPQGALMATLDRSPYDSAVDQARAELKSIQSGLENAEILLQRRLELIPVGAVSQEDLDNALAARDEYRSNYDAAKAALTIAEDNLEYTQVFAPSEGIILTRIREPGSVVVTSDPVYTLSISSPIWIRAFVDEPNLGNIFYGMEAKVYTDTHGGPVYSGKIGFISPVSEFTPKTVETTKLRTDLVYRLRIYVDNPDKYLKQGMPVTIKLDTTKKASERTDE